MPIISPWKLHKFEWQHCELCDLCEHRRKVVLARGSLPAEVLFIGEAPGPSEDSIGEPFVGPAGHFLDGMLQRAGFNVCDHGERPVTRCFTNLVGCIPKDEENKKFAEPPKHAILACSPRLLELVAMCKPKVIVCVGKLSEKWARKILEGKNVQAGTGKMDQSEKGVHPGSGKKSKVERVGHDGRAGKKPRIMGSSSAFEKVQERDYAFADIMHPAAILRMREEAPDRYGLAIQRTIVALSDVLAELSLRKEKEYVASEPILHRSGRG